MANNQNKGYYLALSIESRNTPLALTADDWRIFRELLKMNIPNQQQLLEAVLIEAYKVIDKKVEQLQYNGKMQSNKKYKVSFKPPLLIALFELLQTGLIVPTPYVGMLVNDLLEQLDKATAITTSQTNLIK